MGPVTSLAWWIANRHPELAARSQLKVTVLGASIQDAVDDGRWYAVLPWLLGNEDMSVDVTLMGLEVLGAAEFAHLDRQLEKTRAGTYRMFEHEIAPVLAPATLASTTAEQYFAKARTADLYAMFHPGFEQFSKSGPQWLKPGQLDAMPCDGTPVAVFSYARVEYLTEQWLLAQSGYQLSPATTANPFAQGSTDGGAWGAYAWEFCSTPTAKTPINDVVQGSFADFERCADRMISRMGRVPADDLGLVRRGRIPGHPEPVRLVPLAVTGLWVSPDLELVLEDGPAGLTPVDVPLPASHWAKFKGLAEDSFESMAWAFEAFCLVADFPGPDDDGEGEEEGEASDDGDDGEGEGAAQSRPHLSLTEMVSTIGKLSALTRELEGKEDDGRLFAIDDDDLDDSMRHFAKNVLGVDISPEEFSRSSRLSGFPHGPTAPSWLTLLGPNLEWDLDEVNSAPSRFQPAAFARDRRRQVRVPVVCENYAHNPSDDKDDLAIEAKDLLAKRYPDGVFLTFKTMFSTEKAGKVFSFAGLYFYRQQWRRVALCPGMVGLDAVLQQLEGRFSFGSPDPRYQDKHSALARALNFMTAGQDPNDPEAATVKFGSGEWFTVIPDVMF